MSARVSRVGGKVTVRAEGSDGNGLRRMFGEGAKRSSRAGITEKMKKTGDQT